MVAVTGMLRLVGNNIAQPLCKSLRNRNRNAPDVNAEIGYPGGGPIKRPVERGGEPGAPFQKGLAQPLAAGWIQPLSTAETFHRSDLR